VARWSVEIAAIGVQRPFVLEALEQEFTTVWEAADRTAALPGPPYRHVCLPGRCDPDLLRSRGVEEVVSIDLLKLQAAQERDAGLRTLAEYHSGYLDQNNGIAN
jgi:hypothetical protein